MASFIHLITNSIFGGAQSRRDVSVAVLRDLLVGLLAGAGDGFLSLVGDVAKGKVSVLSSNGELVVTNLAVSLMVSIAEFGWGLFWFEKLES